jgi:hypothetical protein
MKELIGMLKASLPVVIGVAVGMIAYEQIKKATTKTVA